MSEDKSQVDVTDEMMIAAQRAYRNLAVKNHWGGSWPSGEAMREIIIAAMTSERKTNDHL